MSVLVVMRNWLLIGLVGMAALFGCAPKSDVKQPEPVDMAGKVEEPVDSMDKLELSSQMKSAIHEARAELPEFWKAWENNGFGEGDYIVNVQFMNEDESRGEFLWMSVEAYGEGEVTGLMEGVPTVRTDIKTGDRVTVKESDVVDWMFLPKDGDHKGGYTLKALGTSAE